jgi:hypothetical protein
MSTNLWPDFDSANLPRSPKAVVEQAGDGLREKTGGVVVFFRTGTTIRSNRVEISYSLYTPTLAYHFPFLRVRFSVNAMYPVTVVTDNMEDGVANDENELTTLLAKIFNAPSTVATIQRLMALAKA